MGKINWGRVVLCGLVTGGVSMALTAPIFLLALRDTEYVQALHAARAAAHPRFEPILVTAPLNLPAVERTGLLGVATTVWTVLATACFLPSFVIAWQSLAANRRMMKARALSA